MNLLHVGKLAHRVLSDPAATTAAAALSELVEGGGAQLGVPLPSPGLAFLFRRAGERHGVPGDLLGAIAGILSGYRAQTGPDRVGVMALPAGLAPPADASSTEAALLSQVDAAAQLLAGWRADGGLGAALARYVREAFPQAGPHELRTLTTAIAGAYAMLAVRGVLAGLA